MWRPSAARKTLGLSPLVQARWADASSVERVPCMPAGARPAVVFTRRPVAKWATNARAGVLVESGVAIDYSGDLVSHPRYYEAHERPNRSDDSRRLAGRLFYLRRRNCHWLRHVRNTSTFLGGVECRTPAALKVISAKRAGVGMGGTESRIETTVLRRRGRSWNLHHVFRGCGIGRALFEAVIESSETNGIWTLQGATIAENTASLTLQERCGFRVIGRRERIGKLSGVWRDTILTERRSEKVGIE